MKDFRASLAVGFFFSSVCFFFRSLSQDQALQPTIMILNDSLQSQWSITIRTDAAVMTVSDNDGSTRSIGIMIVHTSYMLIEADQAFPKADGPECRVIFSNITGPCHPRTSVELNHDLVVVQGTVGYEQVRHRLQIRL